MVAYQMGLSVAACLRCSTCGTDWPSFHEYRVCPRCRERTDAMSNGTPLTLQEASKLKRQLEFERMYEARERSRVGPSPEQLGREEAREILRLDALVRSPIIGRSGG